MKKYDFDMLVLGGGAAGLTVASGSAQLGAKTMLVEKEEALGGDCLHFGCVPSKTLIHTARVWHTVAHTRFFGLPDIDMPAVDFSKIRSRINKVIDTIQVHDSVERFSGLGVEVVFGRASFVCPHTVVVNGKKYTARKIAIATGSSPAIPAVPGLDSVFLLTNKNIFSLSSLPQKLIVLGGGPIGAEMAQAFTRLGSQVDLLQRGDEILSREDTDMACIVAEQMETDGVNIHRKVCIQSVQKADSDVRVVYLDKEGTERILQGDALLVALGRTPNIGELKLQNAGVHFSEKGISVDKSMRTSQKHIFAAGDVTGEYLFTHAAGYEGGIIVANAVMHVPKKADYTHFPACTYTEPELATIGLNEKAAKKAGRKVEVLVEEFKNSDRALTEARPMGRIKLLLEKGKPVGVQIAGPHAGDLINEWVALQNAGGKLSSLAGAIHPYPTLGEINKRVAGSYFSSRIFSPKVRKILRLLFQYQGEGPTSQ